MATGGVTGLLAGVSTAMLIALVAAVSVGISSDLESALGTFFVIAMFGVFIGGAIGAIVGLVAGLLFGAIGVEQWAPQITALLMAGVPLGLAPSAGTLVASLPLATIGALAGMFFRRTLDKPNGPSSPVQPAFPQPRTLQPNGLQPNTLQPNALQPNALQPAYMQAVPPAFPPTSPPTCPPTWNQPPIFSDVVTAGPAPVQAVVPPRPARSDETTR